MADNIFLNHCKRKLNTCIRLVEQYNEDGDTKKYVLRSLESVEIAIRRKTTLRPEYREELLSTLSKIKMVVSEQEEQNTLASSTGYCATRVCQDVQSGPPKFQITEEQLKFLVHCNFTGPQMADIFVISLSTVRRRLKEYNIKLSTKYSALSDQELDAAVKVLLRGNQLIGPCAVQARLRGKGTNIQRQRVRDSMFRVDPDGVALRSMSRRIERRQYMVPGPNSLWHVDGNHKLIRWRIVIHGGIDGFSRVLTFLAASDNNRAATVFEKYMDGVASYGVPSRLRVDHGGENADINVFMELYRGPNRGSCIRGKSVHNQRIERLWVDQWTGVVNVYHDIFSYLETIGLIDPSNENHIWALHFVYLPRINRDLTNFQNQWNNHGIRTESSSSPIQIFVKESLKLSSSSLTAIKDLFNVPGDEQSQPVQVPAELHEVSQVDVPITNMPISEEAYTQLKEQINPLDDEIDLFGLNIVRNTLDFIQQN